VDDADWRRLRQACPDLAASPDDRLGHDLAAVQNGVGQMPVDLADGGDRAELVEPG
jgi:hypothetical protein